MVLCMVPETKRPEKAADHPFGKKCPQGRATSFISSPMLGQAAHLSQPFHHSEQRQ